MTTTVHNLSTDEERTYTLGAREAVIAARAQVHGDWNTWDYEKKYGHLVEHGKVSVACGDWVAKLSAQPC